MENYIPKTKEFFIERIGKRIYRDKQIHCCTHCDDVGENGLIVMNEQHADYLAMTDTEFANQGIYSNYRDKKGG